MGYHCKFILLKNTKVCQADESELEVQRGEILEESDIFLDVSSNEVTLLHSRLQVKLTCQTIAVARLSDQDAAELMKLKSPQQRLAEFQARSRFDKPPRKGSDVFVAVKGKDFKGLVMVVTRTDDKHSLFGVQVLFDEVALQQHDILKDGTFKTCEKDELFNLPNGGIGVLVSLEKLRPLNSMNQTVKAERKLLSKVPRWIGTIKELKISERKLRESEDEMAKTKKNCKDLMLKLSELEQKLCSVGKAKEEAENQLRICEEKLKLKATSSVVTFEKQGEPNEVMLQRIAFEQKAKEEAEKQLQQHKEKSEELQTTLTTMQNLLKKKSEPENEYEWFLNREEIRLTEENLGSGSFGTVYKGLFRGTQVAVKQVSVKPKITEYNMKNFRREMRMAARCRHPCMLQFIGATSDDQSPLLVTELMDTSLKEVLLERELQPMEIKTIALDVAKGLSYLHLTQPYPIVHRDISSGNVLLWQHGQSWRGKISDYGNAVLMNYARTGSGGALPYLAPEMDNQKCSTKSDVYSFGVLLLEMCLRQEPSSQDDRNSLVCQVEDGAMRQLIRRCIEPDPTQRPSMEEVLVALTTVIQIDLSCHFALYLL